MRQAIIWTNAHMNHWRIYAALGGDELMGAWTNSLKTEMDEPLQL